MRILRVASWVFVGVLWCAALYVWPRLRVDDSETSRNWQATADVTLATIVGTIVVLVLTVGLLAVQMLSPFGWRATRMLVNRSFYAATTAVVVGGVLVPVWVAANPTPDWTRLSFLVFGWSLLLIAFIGTAVVTRMSPHALVAIIASRARTTSNRVLRKRPVLDAETEVLVELFASPALPDACRQTAANAIVHTMTAKQRVDENDFETHLEALVTATEQLTSSEQQHAVVTLLHQLTEDHTTSSVRFTTEHALRRIAGNARLSGQRDVGKHALDTLAELNRAWLMRILPVHHLTPLETPDDGIVSYGAEVNRSDTASDMVDDLVAVLRGHLSAPHPSSEGWPDGWQGPAAYKDDLERIAMLPIALYGAFRYHSSNAAEQALAEAAADGRENLIATLLGKTMFSAYRAGFDQRAQITGGRLIALATDAVHRNEQSAAKRYLRVLCDQLAVMPNQHEDGRTAADDHRDVALRAGLIARTTPLLAASSQDRDFYDDVSQYVDEITNSTSLDTLLELKSWRVRFAAAGWPAEPLPEVVLAAVEDHLALSLFPADVAALPVLVLWANAVRSDARDQLRGKISTRLAEYLESTPSLGRPTEGPFERLCRATVDWAEGRGDPRVPTTDYPDSLTFTAIDRQYHGLTIQGETAVLAVESDGSHRLLRTEDGRTSQVFTWGYTGSGPHKLARALVDDSMHDTLRCPDCLGTASAARGLITCANCDNTGHRLELPIVVSAITEQVLQHLPGLAGTEAAWPGAEWTLSHRLLVAHATDQQP